MANLSAIKLPNGTTYNLKDNGALQLTGGQVTGPVTFGDSIYADDLTAGQLVVEGSASIVNNLQANTINGVTVGSSPKFTDTITTVSTTGSGNAITAISASNGALTATKGTTFLTAHNTYTISTTGSGNAVTAVSLSGTTFTVTKGATYSNNSGTVTKVTAGTGLSIGTTAQGNFTTSGTINHTNSVTAQTTQAVYPIKIDAQGHISAYGSAVTIPTKTSQLTNDSGYITNAGVTGVKGNSESTYRTGQVNLTAANIGAVATSGNETVAGNKTFSGTTSLTAASTYPASQNTIITPNAGAIIQSPIPKYLWHDIIAFCKATTPTYYTTTNGSTWTTATLEKRLFAHMNNWGNQQILNSSIQGSRWVWHGGGFAYSSLSWIILGITYNANIATFDLLLETTADATASSPTWTTLCSVTGAKYNQQPIWIKASGPSSTGDLRLTITRTSGDTTTNVLPICAIEFLTTRWGDQGKGVEFEYPYNWDGTPNIYPIQNNVSNLGSSSNKWANIYATTLNGSLAWSSVSGKPTATGSSATGITASTTATKTTLGTAFTIPNVTGVGSASTWAFEDVACDDITSWSAGSGSASISGAVNSSDSSQLDITISHTHTAPSLSYTAKTASHVKSGGNGSAPTLGTAFTVPNVTGNTSATVSITDPKHTHTIS